MKTCTTDGCHRPHKARGLCDTHYKAARRSQATSQRRGGREAAKMSRDGTETPAPVPSPPGKNPSPAGANLAAVNEVLAGLPPAEQNGWKATLARTLAGALDAEPQASLAAQLRAVMNDIDGQVGQEADALDELASRRAARIAEAKAQ